MSKDKTDFHCLRPRFGFSCSGGGEVGDRGGAGRSGVGRLAPSNGDACTVESVVRLETEQQGNTGTATTV